MIDFNHFSTKSIIVRFPCSECGSRIETGEIIVPNPDYNAEKASDSNNSEMETFYCPNKDCEAEYDITINVNFYGGDIEVSGIDDEYIEIETIADESEEEYYRDYYGALVDTDQIYPSFIASIKNLRALNAVALPNDSLHPVLKRQIFTTLISTLEAFLSETFIKFTLSDDKYLRAFVHTNPEFAKRKFDLKDVFEAYEKITDTAKRVMLDVIYHNLPIVKQMYEHTFGIKFPDIDNVIRAVNIRHDMVHRNGKTKTGEMHELTFARVEEYILMVEEFVEEITQLMLFNPIDDADVHFGGLFDPPPAI